MILSLKKGKLLCFLILFFMAFVINAQDFTKQIWDDNYSLYQKILNMPFNKELLAGTLDEKIFKIYMVQDYLYLENYKKVFGILLAKAPDERGTKLVISLIEGCNQEEKEHLDFLKEFNITEQDLENAIPIPSTEFYNSYLVKTAILEPFEVGLAASLPCCWIYYRIGVDMKSFEQAKNSKYQKWIDIYGVEPWTTSETKKFVDLLEYYMKKTTVQAREKMEQSFRTAMKLEYIFWNDIYNSADWPL